MKIHHTVLKNIEIEAAVAEGKCIARHEGHVIFVQGAAPGDVCDLKIIRKKKNFAEAVILHFHRYSEWREEPFCIHYGTCGGCKWQHLRYDAQLMYKQQQVADSFERIGKVSTDSLRPIIPAKEQKYYRNKLEFTFSASRWLTTEEIRSGEDLQKKALGFHIPKRFDKILDIEVCYLQPEPSNSIRIAVKKCALDHEIPFFNLTNQTGFLRNLIIRTASTGQVMVILQVAGDDTAKMQPVLSTLEQFEEITSLNYVVNTKGNDTFSDLEVITVKGLPYIEEQMTMPQGDKTLTFRIGPKSFYQTNSRQAEVLYKKAWELARISSEDIVYDLYTGTGTIANYVASSAAHVVGIEYVEEAIAYAKVNSQVNGLGNTSFYAGDMKDMLTTDLIRSNGAPDVVITDPPRAGMHPDVCAVLRECGAKRIVYISCNPATQARDIQLLADKYDVTEIQPVDMFPLTHHVECIAVLELVSEPS